MDQVEEVLSKVDIVELINERVPLKKAGRNFKANCPFHSEKTPSFIVSPERQIFKCFGCGAGGNAYKFLMEYEKMDFGEALNYLANQVGVRLKSYRPGPEETKKRRLYEINHLAAETYHFLLTKHQAGKTAREYLANRGISQKTIEEFMLGYAPGEYEFLAKFLIDKKDFLPEEVEASGLVFKNDRGNLIDRFRDRIMFPLYDPRGNIAGFSGRIIKPQENTGKYINTPETMIYHKSQLLFGFSQAKEALRKTKQAVVVEGEFDMISPFQIGVKNIVAIKGSALTEEQIRLLGRYVEELILALDADSAGDAAARRGIQLAVNEGLNVKVVSLGDKFKDPDEAARADPEFFKKQVKRAQSIFDFYIDSALKRFDVATAWGKKKIVDEVAPILAGINDEILQSHYVQELSGRLKVDQEAVWKKIHRAWPAADDAQDNYQDFRQEPRKNRHQMLLDYLFALCFQEEQQQELIKQDLKELISNPGLKRIADLLEEYLSTHDRFDSQEFVKKLPDELVVIFNNFFVYPLSEKVTDSQSQEKEINQIKQELKLIDLKERKSRLSTQISQAEKNGQEQEVEKLSRQIDNIDQKIKQLITLVIK
ncbi:MAG: DNA primase [Candidatus Shapirobacteria bacterium]|nr:DNA primase [Candidatus Shapirobacteria bacterium]